MYLLLSNPNIRDVIDTITSKVALILGRFTKPRKRVLDELRNQLRDRGLSPVVFDFEIPTNRDMTDTVRLLAGMARFVIADLTRPGNHPVRTRLVRAGHPGPGASDHSRQSAAASWLQGPQEASSMAPRSVPVESLESLLENLEAEVIDPADAKREELNG